MATWKWEFFVYATMGWLQEIDSFNGHLEMGASHVRCYGLVYRVAETIICWFVSLAN